MANKTERRERLRSVIVNGRDERGYLQVTLPKPRWSNPNLLTDMLRDWEQDQPTTTQDGGGDE